MDPCIAHIDIDAFFASVEQILVPRLRGRPVAVGSGCIASCSYEARRFGLHAGLSLAAARRMCPEVVILPGSQGVYRCFSERVWELCREVSPAVETHLDDAYLDLAGTPAQRRDPRAAVEALRQRIRRQTGLAATAGIGPSRMIARLAGKCAKPDGLMMVAAGEIDAFLVDRPVGDIPGVGARTAAMLGQFNIHTVRDLRAVPRDTLAAVFGRNGAYLFDRARGVDTRAVSLREIPRTISRETTFHKETSAPAEHLAMLHYLCERAMKPVRELGLVTGRVAVRLRYADMKEKDARRPLAPATRLTTHTFDAAAEVFRALHDRRVALRFLGVTLSDFRPDHGDSPDLFPSDDARAFQLAVALDAVRRRFGFSALVAGKSIDLLGALRRDKNGFVLRTPCLTK
jgi:DNA polymerase IV